MAACRQAISSSLKKASARSRTVASMGSDEGAATGDGAGVAVGVGAGGGGVGVGATVGVGVGGAVAGAAVGVGVGGAVVGVGVGESPPHAANSAAIAMARVNIRNVVGLFMPIHPP